MADVSKEFLKNLGVSTFQSGTSATLVMLENAPDKAFDPEVLAANHTKNEQSKLTTKMLCDDVNFSKLTQASIAQILGIIIKHIPSLAHYKEELMEAYATKWAIHQIQPKRSQIHPLHTTSIDKSKTEGNQDVLYDSFLTQMQMCKDKIQSTLFLVTGDQLSIQ